MSCFELVCVQDTRFGFGGLGLKLRGEWSTSYKLDDVNFLQGTVKVIPMHVPHTIIVFQDTIGLFGSLPCIRPP